MSLEQNPLLTGANSVDWHNVLVGAEEKAKADGKLPEFRSELEEILRRLDGDYTGVTSFASPVISSGERKGSVRTTSIPAPKPGTSVAA